MKWYDYIICVLIADYMTGMLFAGSILVFVPYLIFDLYCDIRKHQEMRNE
jgi:hypothetical protein